MDFNIPSDIQDLLDQLDQFIEDEIKPLERENDNIRFFDHRREDSRTDWDRNGWPNEEWEALLKEMKRRADAAGFLRWHLPERFGGQSGSNLGMAIELFNGPMIHKKLRDPKNSFRAVFAAGKDSAQTGQLLDEAIRDLYLSALCRQPSPIELKAALEHCATRENPASGVEDVCWALFNTDEFLFQH